MSEELLGVEALEKRISTNKSTAAHFAAVGMDGLERSGGSIQEEFLTALRMPDCLKTYQEMSWNDPVIGAVLFVFEELARRCQWSVEAGGKKQVDLAAKQFLEECRDDMEQSFVTYIIEVLSMFVYGWSLHEIIYKLRRGYNRNPKFNSKFNDGKIGWRFMPGRSQASWNDWKYNEITQELDYFEQMVPSTGDVILIPMSRCLLFRTKTDRNSPEGRSLLRNAYRPWFFKKHIEEIEAIGIERDLAGFPTLIAAEGIDIWNANNEDAVALKATVEQIVANVRMDKNLGLVLPHGWDFKLANSGGGKQIDTNAVINRIDQRIAATLLADIVMLGADKVGSFALADVKKSLLASALEGQIKIIADIFNKQAVPTLMELNNFKGITDFPKFVPSEIEVPDINNLADFLTKLSKLGVVLFPDEKLERYIASTAGLPDGSINSAKKGTTDPDTSDQKIKVDLGTGKKGPTKEGNPSDDKTKFNQIYDEGGRK